MKVIIPSAGQSSRYNSKKPKYLLTHPSGFIMIELVMISIRAKLKNCDFSVIILREHEEKFKVSKVLKQIASQHNLSVDITILNKVSSGPADTIYQYLKKSKYSGPFLIKDSDNIIEFNRSSINFKDCDGILLGGDIAEHNIKDVHQKSFIVSDNNGYISNFVEKRVVSNIVCFGLYGFACTNFFKKYYKKVIQTKFLGELFVSHIIQKALLDGKTFKYKEALSLNDWGIWDLWLKERRRHRSFFLDFDGVFVKNTGKYGDPNWDNDFIPLEKNISLIKMIYDSGSQIIITTSRPVKYKKKISTFLKNYEIIPFSYVFGLNHSERVILNDYSDSNPFPSASALNLIRDGELEVFLDILK